MFNEITRRTYCLTKQLEEHTV